MRLGMSSGILGRPGVIRLTGPCDFTMYDISSKMCFVKYSPQNFESYSVED